MIGILEWTATLAVALGALMVAHQGAWLRHGFTLCLASNVLWTLFALHIGAPGLVVTQVVFGCINLYGLYRTTPRVERPQVEAMEASELCPWRVP